MDYQWNNQKNDIYFSMIVAMQARHKLEQLEENMSTKESLPETDVNTEGSNVKMGRKEFPLRVHGLRTWYL